MKPVPYFINTDGKVLGFCIKCSERFPYVWGKVKLLLPLVLTPMYVAEQGFNQVLHMRNKYRNRFDINKTVGNATRIKLTNLQPASKTYR